MLSISIGDKGTFKFSNPFDGIIPDNILLTVESIESIRNMSANGLDPFENIYRSYGLLETDYNYDLSNNIEIVTLSNGSDFYYIPSNRILSVPVIDGVIYRNKVISIPLGNIPDDLNLKTLLDNLNDAVLDTVGIKTIATVVSASTEIHISNTTHNAFMAKIENNKRIDSSYKSKYEKLLTERIKLLATIKELEEALKIISPS